MQRYNNGTASVQPACAACKHQRKKCHDGCTLAPYFPAEKNREFQAVHKVFGVSNVTKMVKNVGEEDRRRTVESLVWEAIWRQRDPILGPYGEYKRVHDELKKYKLSQNQNLQGLQLQSQIGNLGYNKPVQGLIGWNNNNNSNGIISNKSMSISEILNNNNNQLSYVNDVENSIIDSIGYNCSSTNYVQSPEIANVRQEKNFSSVVVPFQQQQQQHCITTFSHNFYL